LNPLRLLGRAVASALILIIWVYQLTLSRLLPAGVCRFEPSCSHYCQQALAKRGLLAGLVLGSWRIMRCQPFGTPGYDPVPERGFRARPRPLPT
jgi:hypothetical protein